MSNTPRVELRNVSKQYGGIAALDQVTFHVAHKEYVCILGPSGCGKSTLIKCIAGIIRPDTGEILIDDQPLERVSIEDRNIGYVFQEIALFPHMSARENVSYGPTVRNASAEQTTVVTNEMLDLINMRERGGSYPRELSGGAQQKVAVARAIATGSQLFLLDEPLGALDALVRAEMRYELKKLANDLGLTIIHVTHDQEEALSIADRVVLMKSGRIVEVGKPSEIYLSPKSLFAENFVGESNLLEGSVLETDGVWCTVGIDAIKIRVFGTNKTVGQRVIVAIRPEFVPLAAASASTGNETTGNIAEVTFLGSLIRYQIQLNESRIKIAAHSPSSNENTVQFHLGDRVKVPLNHCGEHMLLFNYPKEGLEKEIALE